MQIAVVPEDMGETTKSKRIPDFGMTAMSLSPLASPAFWAALGVLLLNDHVLKRAGILPGVVTGKLSDFAGLVVAPVLLATLLGGLRRPVVRALAFAIVVAGFVAVKLSGAAASFVGDVLGRIGVPSRIWADPTDLVALAILPFAWRIASVARAGGGLRQLAAKGAVFAGGLACVATSQEPPLIEGTWLTDAWAVNHTGAPVDLRISWARGELDCAAIAGRASRVFAPDAFDDGITFAVEADHTIPFERAAAQSALVEGGGPIVPETRACDAVRLQADGLPDTVVFWSGLPMTSVNTEDTARGAEIAGRVEVTTDGDALAVAGSGVEIDEIVERLEPSGCENDPQMAFQSSIPDLEFDTDWTLDAFEVGGDGCLLLEFSETIDTTLHHLGFLCIPPDEFPFAPADVLTLSRPGAGGIRMRRASTDTTPGADLTVWSAITSLIAPAVTAVSVDWCDGDRLDCNGYVLPGAIDLEGSLVRPGEEVDLGPDSRGWPGRMLVGRAEHVVLGMPECDVDEQAVATFADVLVVFEEEVVR
jgi:hypothetical protein